MRQSIGTACPGWLCERRNRAVFARRVPQWTFRLRRRGPQVYAFAVMRGAASPGVEHTLRELAGRLEEEIDELVATMLPRTRAEVPDFDIGSRPELRDAERASIYGNIRAVLGALGGDRAQPGAPAEAM